jgi:antitoxin HicB
LSVRVRARMESLRLLDAVVGKDKGSPADLQAVRDVAASEAARVPSYDGRVTRRPKRRDVAVSPQADDEGTAITATGHVELPHSPKTYLDLPYQIAVRRDQQDGGWTAHVEEFPGCEARGNSPEQATRQLRGAMEEWIREALERGQDIPEPRALSGHSGRLLLRMPQSLHSELAHSADAEGISLNQFITTTLASAVGWRNHPAPRADSGHSLGREAMPVLAEGADRTRRSRRANVIFAANLIMLCVLATLAVVLVLVAWHQT